MLVFYFFPSCDPSDPGAGKNREGMENEIIKKGNKCWCFTFSLPVTKVTQVLGRIGKEWKMFVELFWFLSAFKTRGFSFFILRQTARFFSVRHKSRGHHAKSSTSHSLVWRPRKGYHNLIILDFCTLMQVHKGEKGDRQYRALGYENQG